MACSVLIVDDHAGFRAQARELLAVAGYDVVGEAADGASGVRVARDLSPDIVLLDVQLPDATGFEVISQIASEPDPPVIVLISSRDAADYGSRVARSGARGFITKAELPPRCAGSSAVNGSAFTLACLRTISSTRSAAFRSRSQG
jgi:DNA-binding NarL/FixJ family response regulator